MNTGEIQFKQMIAGELAVVERLKRMGLVPEKPKQKMENETPRRNRLDLNTPAEIAIHNAMQEIEKIGANVKLTEAIILLQQAKDKVADYIDIQKS
jgi:hypothetical protein